MALQLALWGLVKLWYIRGHVRSYYLRWQLQSDGWYIAIILAVCWPRKCFRTTWLDKSHPGHTFFDLWRLESTQMPFSHSRIYVKNGCLVLRFPQVAFPVTVFNRVFVTSRPATSKIFMNWGIPHSRSLTCTVHFCTTNSANSSNTCRCYLFTVSNSALLLGRLVGLKWLQRIKFFFLWIFLSPDSWP